MSDWGPSLTLRDAGGKMRAVLGVPGDEVRSFLSNERGKQRATVRAFAVVISSYMLSRPKYLLTVR